MKILAAKNRLIDYEKLFKIVRNRKYFNFLSYKAKKCPELRFKGEMSNIKVQANRN